MTRRRRPRRWRSRAAQWAADDSLPTEVVPGAARDSYLVWRLLGRAPSHASRRAVTYDLMPPTDDAPPLGDGDKRKIIEWIDLGARFSKNRDAPVGSAETNRGNRP